MQLTPDGDCREASFIAKGAGLRVPPLSAVQIEYLAPSGWTPLYYGEVRQGGNARDVNGETYILRSLALRLKEVTLPADFKTPEQPAHLTVRAIIQAVLPRLAGTVLYDTALCPDLGFDCQEIKNAHQQNAWAFLERIAQDGAGMGVTVAWGVRPDRTFFFQVARADTAAFSESETLALTWKPPIAETPCTAVLWLVAKRANGDWVTHLSESPDAATYGRRVKALSVSGDVPVWETVPGAYEVQRIAESGGWETMSAPTPAQAAAMTDGRSGLDDPRWAEDVPERFMGVRLTTQVPFTRLVFAGAVNDRTQEGGEGTAAVQLRVAPSPTNSGAAGGVLLGSGVGTVSLTVFAPEPMTQVRAEKNNAQPGSTASIINLAELRAERINTALLDRLAQYHYSVPASEPADIELATYRAPADLAGCVTLNDYTRAVEAWEYRLTAGRGLTLAALTGQADDPAKLAQAALIKARDGQATITALTAQT